MISLKHRICFVSQEAVSAAFNAANQYADTFEPYREFYRENETLDLDAVRSQEHGKSLTWRLTFRQVQIISVLSGRRTMVG